MSSAALTRRDAAAVETRAAILASARTAFGERGFAAVSLAEIARGAGATTGALYHHFADKKSLFAAVAEGIEAEIVAHITRSISPTADLWEIVAYAVTETLAFTAHPGIVNVIFKDAPTVLGTAEWREIEMRHGFGQLHALLRALAATNRLANYDPEIVAGIILGASIQTADAVVRAERPIEALDAGSSAMLALLTAYGFTIPH